jgi:hypothetical protein
MTGKITAVVSMKDVVVIKALPPMMIILPLSLSSVALRVGAVADAVVASLEKAPRLLRMSNQKHSTQHLPQSMSSQNTTTIPMPNLLETITVAALREASVVDLMLTLDLLLLFLEAVLLKEVVVALVASAVMKTNNLLTVVTSRKSTVRLPVINHAAVVVAGISTNTRTRTVAMTSSANNKKLVNSISHANIVTTIVEEVAVAVAKLPASVTSATVSTLKGRSAKAMARISLPMMAAMSSWLQLEEVHVGWTAVA